MQRLLNQFGVFHLADGCPGGDYLWKRQHEDTSSGDELHGVGVDYATAHEPLGLTHRSCQNEVQYAACFFPAPPPPVCKFIITRKAPLWLDMSRTELFSYLIHSLTVVSLFLIGKCFLSFLSLIHSIATRVIKLAHAKSSLALAPALVETYSRLLVYMEIESLGIKGFISKKKTLFLFFLFLE